MLFVRNLLEYAWTMHKWSTDGDVWRAGPVLFTLTLLVNINTELCLILNTISFVYTALVSGEAALGAGQCWACIPTLDGIFICHTLKWNTPIAAKKWFSKRPGDFYLDVKKERKEGKDFSICKGLKLQIKRIKLKCLKRKKEKKNPSFS